MLRGRAQHPICGVLGRVDSNRYRRSLRPCSWAPIAPAQRTDFRQTLLAQRAPLVTRLEELVADAAGEAGERRLEEELDRRGPEPRAQVAVPLDEAPQRFVARPGQASLLGVGGNASCRFGTREARIVQPDDRFDEL